MKRGTEIERWEEKKIENDKRLHIEMWNCYYR